MCAILIFLISKMLWNAGLNDLQKSKHIITIFLPVSVKFVITSEKRYDDIYLDSICFPLI